MKSENLEEKKKEIEEAEAKADPKNGEPISDMLKKLETARSVFVAKVKRGYGALKQEVKELRNDYGNKVDMAIAAYVLCLVVLIFAAARICDGEDMYVAGNSANVKVYYVDDQALKQGADPALIEGSETYLVTRGATVKRLRKKK